MVRCARCQYQWVAELPEEPAAERVQQLSATAPPPAGLGLTAMPVIGLPATGRDGKSFWTNDWVIAGLTLFVSLFLLLLAIDRKDIASRWPITEALYDRVGLHIYHAGEGLELLQVHSEMTFDGGMTKLTLEGQIHNKTDKPQSVPNLLAAAVGSDGSVMQSWQIDAPKATLAPGESMPFTSEIRAPQGTVVDINIHFIEPNNAS